MKWTRALIPLLITLLPGCSNGDDGVAVTTTTPATTVAVPTTAALPAAPWGAPKLRADQVPAVLLREWEAGGSRAECAALAPSDLGVPNGTPRRAEFGPGAWAVAWDVPGAPGRQPSGQPCASCGRGTVVVAGTGVDVGTASRPGPSVLPVTKRWADGSIARYGLEGSSGPAYLAQLEVSGQRCLYNVSSFLGQAHLERLLESLRFVQGAP